MGRTYNMHEKDMACAQMKLTLSREELYTVKVSIVAPSTGQVKDGINFDMRAASCVMKKKMGKPKPGKWMEKKVSGMFDASNDAIIKVRVFARKTN